MDGHEFVPAAVAAGAIGVVVERELEGLNVPQLVVDRTRRALADAADEWFGRPSEQLKVVGVTGTDGKSTVTGLTAEMLWACRWHPGQIGTVFTGIFDDLEPNLERNTTPEALELQELLARMVAAGNDSVVMEATSHGLALERTRNCRFDVGVVTTVTSEHLELHGTVEAYRAAKALLIEEAPIAVLNADDASFDYFRERARDRVITYGIDAAADLRAGHLEADGTGTSISPRVASLAWRGPDRAAGTLQRRERAGGARGRRGIRARRPPCGDCPGHHPRRARTNGTGRRRPAVRRDRRLRAHRGRPAQGAGGDASARPRPADRRVRLGRGTGPDEACADGPRRRPSWPTS